MEGLPVRCSGSRTRAVRPADPAYARAMDVTTALHERVSVRAFLPDPVSEDTVRGLLETARWSPSGGNLQPWRVIVVSGAERDAVVRLARQAQESQEDGGGAEFPIYPAPLHEPFRTRRFTMGEQMYEVIGVPREDKAARYAHLARNFEFFGAPVAVFFVVDRRLGHGQWAHLGMFMQSLALAATEQGLATCFQEYWGTVRAPLAEHFGLDGEHTVYCAMALGHPDPDAPLNTLRTDRAGGGVRGAQGVPGPRLRAPWVTAAVVRPRRCRRAPSRRRCGPGCGPTGSGGTRSPGCASGTRPC